jgi:hypothetical protein
MEEAHKFRFSKYNDPRHAESIALLKAIGEATDEFEMSVLLYKLNTIDVLLKRGIISDKAHGKNMITGKRFPFENENFVVDLISFNNEGNLFVRCLADGERLYYGEYPFWQVVAEDPMTEKLIFVHESAIERIDAEYIQTLIKRYGKVELMQIPREAK